MLIEADIQEWVVPDSVVVRTDAGMITLPLKDVPAAVLADLCEYFRASIFEKAGIVDPETQRAGPPY